VAGVDKMTEGGLPLVILVHLGILVLLLHVMEDRDPTAVITTPLPHGGKTQGLRHLRRKGIAERGLTRALLLIMAPGATVKAQ